MLEVLPAADIEPTSADAIDVSVLGERVLLPFRVYFPEPGVEAARGLSTEQRLVLAAVLTRHCDGFVRERWVSEIAPVAAPWIAPFVTQLLSEYVREITLAIEAVMPADPEVYRAFAAANEEYCRLVSARMVNYWALYYRHQDPSFVDYPACRVARQLGVWRGRFPRKRRAV